VKLLIFDMDGTLLDTRVDITISVNYVRQKRHGLPPLSEEEVVEFINRDERNLPLLFYGTETALPEDRECFRSHYLKQCTRNLRLFPGVRETLETLTGRGVVMAVATNASTLFARRMLGAMEIEKHFTSIVGADTTGRSKPDPSMIHAVMQETGFETESHRAWLLGDSGKDMAAARNANIGALFAAWGYSRSLEADVVLKSPGEILDVIG